MIDKKIHDRVIQRVDECLAVFESIKGVSVQRPAIEYTLTGTNAGMAHNCHKVQLNPILLTENLDEYLSQTIPHEMGHICAYFYYYVVCKTKIQPHGKEWKEIVKAFNAKPNRLHSYDVARVSQRDMTKHLYSCKCGTRHYLSPKKAKNANNLCCAKCNSNLVFVAVGKLSKLQKITLKSS